MPGACVLKPESKRPWGLRSRLRISCLFFQWKLVQSTTSLGYLLPWVCLPLQGFMGRSVLLSSQSQPFWDMRGKLSVGSYWDLKDSWHGCCLVIYPLLAHPDSCSEPSLSTQSPGAQISKGHEMHAHKSMVCATRLCQDIQIWELGGELGRAMVVDRLHLGVCGWLDFEVF